MSKNMTRKGLALGATLALATTGLVATPAFANSVVTSLASGTSFNSVTGYDNELRLSTVMSPGLSGNEGTLHYRISNPSGAALEIGVGRTSTSSGAIALATVATGSPLAPSNDSAGIWGYQNASSAFSTVDGDTDRSNFQTALTDFVVVPTGNRTGVAADENFITVAVIDASAVQNVSVTVTAWLDTAANASNVQDSVEVTGNTVTLSFIDPANVTATSTLVAPVTGAGFVEAEVTTTPELNGQQLGADFIDVNWTAQGNANAVLAENTRDTNGSTAGSTTYSGTTKKWTSKAFLSYSVASDAWNGSNNATNTVVLPVTTGRVHTGGATTTLILDFPAAHGFVSTGGSWVATTAAITDTAGGGATTHAAQSLKAVVATDADTLTITTTGLTGVASPGTAPSAAATVNLFSVGTFATVQASGVYSARPFIGTTALSAAASSTTSSITADDTEAFIAASANVEEGYDDAANATGNAAADADYVLVRTGTSSVTVTATVYYTDALDLNRVKVAPAGIPVVGTIAVGTGTFQVNASGAGVLSDTELTNASGQVTFTVSSSTAANGDNVTIDIRPQSVAVGNAQGAKFDLRWQNAAFTLYDLNTVQDQPGSNASSFRHINSGATYNYAFALLDQWGQAAPDASWRLQVINSGRTVSSDTHALTNGRVSVNVADNAQGSGSTITSTVNVQRLVSGTWTTQATESWDGTGLGTVVINTAAAGTETITLDANGGTTYQSSYNAQTAALAAAVAADRTAAQNRRLSATVQPAYTNAVTLNGRVTAAVTGLAKGGTNVTVTGDSNILFSYGKVDSFGSIVVPADADGDFTVKLFSNKAFDDTVITLTTANGASRTVKVDFGPATATSGRTLTYTSTGGEPGRTLIITGLLADKWGNPVDTDQIATNAAGASTLDNGDARLTVTYTGPGLISGSMPVETGSDGTFVVRVLLGVNDTGSATVSATYGAANGTISSADTGVNIDIKGSVTVNIGKATETVIGSYNGRVAVRVEGQQGARLSVKIGNRWYVATVPSNRYVWSVKSRKGAVVKVNAYINGDLENTQTITVR